MEAGTLMDVGGVIARVVAWGLALGWAANGMPVAVAVIAAILLTLMLAWDLTVTFL